ncbi:MAG: histidine triad nucleotide-binding protein [Acidobacteria bacterium]|nr:MAG: histidine triad nucleotide-binding protein [Acidobacteriota bacterium]
MQQACLFCRIIGYDTPAEFVHEDDLLVAFKDLRPQAPVHLLICPRKHIPTLNDLMPEDNALIGHIFQVVKKLAMQSNIHQKGYRTVFNVNAGAGQSVYHLHLHLLGGRMFSWPPG